MDETDAVDEPDKTDETDDCTMWETIYFCADNNYSEHGDVLKAGENNCFMAKVRYNLAKRIQDGYDLLRGTPTP